MSTLDEAIKLHAPLLGLPSIGDGQWADPTRTPVAVHAWLKAAKLIRRRDTGLQEVLASVTSADAGVFLSTSAEDPDNTWLTAGIVSKEQDQTVDPEAVAQMYAKVGIKPLTYYVAHASAADGLGDTLTPEQASFLAAHAVVTYYLLFPAQDGAGESPAAAASSSEGCWRGLSMLLDPKAGFAPVKVGFHGLYAHDQAPFATILRDWDQLSVTSNSPRVWVAVGTHSCFPAVGVYSADGSLIVGKADDFGDVEVSIGGSFSTTSSSGPEGLAIAGGILIAAGIKVGGPVGIALIIIGILLLLAALIWFLVEKSAQDSNSGSSASAPPQTQPQPQPQPSADSPDEAFPDPAESGAPLLEHALENSQWLTNDAFDGTEQWWWGAECRWGDNDVDELPLMSDGLSRPDLTADFLRAVLEVMA